MASRASGRARPVRVGDEAPAFRLPGAQGGEVALADFRGRRVVLWLSRGIY
jgi:peroxiredoxin